jgi:hypothetical protein
LESETVIIAVEWSEDVEAPSSPCSRVLPPDFAPATLEKNRWLKERDREREREARGGEYSERIRARERRVLGDMHAGR